MSVKHKIQLRRGLKSELDQILLAVGELGFTTDTGEVWIGNGSKNILCGRALVGTKALRPIAGVAGRIYEATDEKITYIDTGYIWKAVGIASLDSIQDGSTYGRVRLTELNSGRVKQIQAVTQAMSISGDSLASHLLNAALHREIDDSDVGPYILWSSQFIEAKKADKVPPSLQNNIATLSEDGNILDSGLRRNDTGTGTQDLWSANKITNEINSKASGLAWQEPIVVLNLLSDEDHGGSPPGDPHYGDAYIVNNWGVGFTNGEVREWDGIIWTNVDVLSEGLRALIGIGAAGTFFGRDDTIAEYDGSAWGYTTAVDGFAVLVTGDGSVFENNGYVFNGTIWIQFTGAGQINAGVGLAKSGNTIDVNLGAGIAELPTDEIGIDITPNKGLRLTSLETDGTLEVDYDNSTIGIVSDKLAVKTDGIKPEHVSSLLAGTGLSGGGGSALSVNIGLGLQVISNIIQAQLQANGSLVVDAGGIGVNVDGTEIVINNNILSLGVIDGGSFEDIITSWYPVFVGRWLPLLNADSDGVNIYNILSGDFAIRAQGDWNLGYRPTKLRIAYSGATITAIRIRDISNNVLQIISGPISSGQALTVSISSDMWDLFFEVSSGQSFIANIEFDQELPQLPS